MVGRLVVGGYLCALVVRALVVGVLGWCGYLHALNLVSLVGVLGWCGYLHALNLVSLVGVSWLVWLPGYLEPRALVVGRLVVGGYLYALNLVSLVGLSWLEVITCIP